MTITDSTIDSAPSWRVKLGGLAKTFVRLGFGMLIIGYFIFYAVFGDRSISAHSAYAGSLAEAQAELKSLREERAVINRQVELLRPDTLNLDALEAEARKQFGYSLPNEVVILQE